MFGEFISKFLDPHFYQLIIVIRIIKKNYPCHFFKIQYPQRIANITVIAQKPGTGVGVRGTGVASVAGADGVGEYVWGTSVGVGVAGAGEYVWGTSIGVGVAGAGEYV